MSDFRANPTPPELFDDNKVIMYVNWLSKFRLNLVWDHKVEWAD